MRKKGQIKIPNNERVYKPVQYLSHHNIYSIHSFTFLRQRINFQLHSYERHASIQKKNEHKQSS